MLSQGGCTRGTGSANSQKGDTRDTQLKADPYASDGNELGGWSVTGDRAREQRRGHIEMARERTLVRQRTTRIYRDLEWHRWHGKYLDRVLQSSTWQGNQSRGGLADADGLEVGRDVLAENELPRAIQLRALLHLAPARKSNCTTSPAASNRRSIGLSGRRPTNCPHTRRGDPSTRGLSCVQAGHFCANPRTNDRWFLLPRGLQRKLEEVYAGLTTSAASQRYSWQVNSLLHFWESLGLENLVGLERTAESVVSVLPELRQVDRMGLARLRKVFARHSTLRRYVSSSCFARCQFGVAGRRENVI